MPLWTLIVAAVVVSPAQAHGHRRQTFHVSAGHLVVLPCSPADQHTNVSWSREGQGLDTTVEVQDRQLWFKPAHPSHSGVYTCHYRSQSGESQAEVELSVSGKDCPFVAEHRDLHQGESGKVPCKLQHIYKAFNLSNPSIHWTKGCAPLHTAEGWVDEWGQLRLPRVSPEDAGTYTCFVHVTEGGQNYSAAWSVEVSVTNDTVFVEPHVVYPRDQVVQVHLGGSVQLRCLADLGYSEDSHTLMYWLLNHTHTDDYPEVNHSWTIVPVRRRVQGVSTLVISEVHHGLLNISIICCVRNAVGEDHGQLWLTQADPNALHSALAWCLSLSLALLLLTALLYCCRVELVLACRDLRSRFPRKYVHDGKLYDGVVSCLHPPGMAPPELSLFSLQVLPQHLEGQWGYRLYVSGRDDCPGESMHEALSETVRKSRTLLLLLCASRTQGALSLSEELPPLCYEQRVGLHDALTQKEPRVILIEISGPVDYSCLPESVQYLRRTQGVLQWRTSPRGRLGLLLRPERSFWNRLRYHMPSVPSGKATPSGAVQSLLLQSPPSPHCCPSPTAAHIELVQCSPSLNSSPNRVSITQRAPQLRASLLHKEGGGTTVL